MKNRKLFQIIIFTVLFLTVPMTYNSCSSNHSSVEDGLTSLAKSCNLESYFSRTWQPFLQQNCATCHASGGQGSGAFADSNVDIAFSSFTTKGFAKVARFAVNPAHNSPYSGPQHETEINDLSERWSAAEIEAAQTCGDSSIGDGRVREDFSTWMRTTSKPIGALEVGDTQTVTWALDQDLLPDNMPANITLDNVEMSVTVEVRDNLGDIYYAIYDPRLIMDNAIADLKVSGLAFRMNGQLIDNQTTFYRVETSKRKNNTNDVPISSGAMIFEGTVRTSDVLSLSIKSLENLDLGPPPEGVLVNFAQSSLQVSEGGTYELVLNLSEELADQVSVQLIIEDNTDALPIDSGRTTESRDGSEQVPIDNFDWDYKFSSTNAIFGYRQTSVTISFWINQDDRYEADNDETFVIEIDDASIGGPAEAGTAMALQVTIDDGGDIPPTPGIPTFSQLMLPGGVLYTNCIKCHNKSENFGGYDVTDYAQMISEGILIPGDSNSTMFVRMNVDDPNIDTMPLDGLLPDFDRFLVEQWILNGAKND